MREAELQAAVTDLCKLYGFLYFHPYDSRRSSPGYPDLTIGGSRVIFRELKSATGRLTMPQATWGSRLRMAGQDWAVWRPEDLRSGRVQRELTAIR